MHHHVKHMHSVLVPLVAPWQLQIARVKRGTAPIDELLNVAHRQSAQSRVDAKEAIALVRRTPHARAAARVGQEALVNLRERFVERTAVPIDELIDGLKEVSWRT